MKQTDFMTKGIAVVPSDSTVLAATSKLYVGVGGDLTVLLAGDTVPVLFKAVPSGSVLPLKVVKVMAAGTAATFIVALY
jgi:hypothetical protein